MAHYTFSTHVAAPPDDVFALWTNLDRIGEWIGGVTGVSDVSGPIDQVGTTYVVHFGPVKSPETAASRSAMMLPPVASFQFVPAPAVLPP